MLLFSLFSLLFLGLGHVYLYLLLLGQRSMKWKAIISISTLFIVFLALSVSFSTMTELNILLLIIFLFALGFFYRKIRWEYNILFTILSITTFTVIRNGLASIIIMVYLSSSAPTYMWTINMLQTISIVFLFFIIFLARKFITDVGRLIRQSHMYIPTYILSIFSTLLLIIVNYPTIPLLASIHNRFGSTIANVLLLTTIALILILCVGTVMSKERLLDKQEEEQQKQLLAYVKKLEFMHDELITFRHDYLNLLLSLEHAIRQENMQQIKQTYYDVLAPTGDSLRHIHVEQAKLSRIKVAELKSLLSVKLLHAERQHIEVQMDIPTEINSVPLPLAAYLRIVSIFIDNAIEGASQSHKRYIQIAIFEANRQHYLIVKNWYDNIPINLQQLYAKQFTLKGEGRGIGLYSVQRLLNKYPEATLLTELEEQYFKQVLCIKHIAVKHITV